MLKQKRLDDQNFIEIVNRSKRLIQKYAPEWTNENASDPGIAILEMLAWLKDSTQYYMDQSHHISTSAYMALLGIHPLPASPAEMIVQAVLSQNNQDGESVKLPKGYPFSARNMPFELACSCAVQPAQIRAVYSSNTDFSARILDLSSAFENNAKAYPLSQEPYAGACLYLGFDTLCSGPLSIYFDMEEDPQGYRNTCDLCTTEFAKGVWEIAQVSDQVVQWHPLEVLRDETCHFMQDGIIMLSSDIEPDTFALLKGEEALVWIRFRLTHTSYDRPPVCRHIYMNGMRLIQQHTHIAHYEFDMNTSHHTKTLEIDGYVGPTDQILVEAGTASEFHPVSENQYTLRHSPMGVLKVQLSTEAFDREDTIRVLIGKADTGGVLTYDIRGLPFDTVESGLEDLLFDSVEMEINEDFRFDLWKKWEVVHHLFASGSQSRHLVLRPDSGQLEFGNNELGALPDPCENGLRLISAITSKKARGNGQYTQVTSAVTRGNLEFKPLTRARNGAEEESVSDATHRFKKTLMTPQVLSGKKHIEEVIGSTPGLAIRDVAVVPSDNAEKMGRIVILPKSFEKHPKLPDIYMEILSKRIEDTRLITEGWLVSGPEYIDMRVKLEIIKDPAVNLSRSHIENVVRAFIEPKYGKRFGKRYATSMLARDLESLSGIVRVSRLSIQTKSGAFKMSEGDIQLPKAAIGRLTQLDLQFLNKQGW